MLGPADKLLFTPLVFEERCPSLGIKLQPASITVAILLQPGLWKVYYK